MTVIDVQLGLRENQPALPQVIKVPVSIMQETGLSRTVAIKTRDQVVPKALRDWMLNHRSYRHWFASGEAVVVDAPGASDDPEPTDPVEEAPQPETDDRAPVIEAMTVAQLKAYADEHDTDIAGLTLKQDIKDAIYVALDTA